MVSKLAVLLGVAPLLAGAARFDVGKAEEMDDVLDAEELEAQEELAPYATNAKRAVREASDTSGIRRRKKASANRDSRDSYGGGGDQTAGFGMVDQLYTIGAVGAGKLTNPKSPDGCFEGLRMWACDTTVCDFAPYFSGFRHAQMDALILKPDGGGKKYYTPCGGPKGQGEKTCRLPSKIGAKRFIPTDPQASALHKTKGYVDRLTALMGKGDPAGPPKEKLNMAKVASVFAMEAYSKCYEAKTNLQQKVGDQGWRLVGYLGTHGVVDADNVLIGQDEQNNCILAFEGSNSVYETYVTNSKSFTGRKKYCGHKRGNTAYVDKLRELVKSLWTEAKEKLSMCDKVYVAGHSLGGAVAETFAACQNRGLAKDPDWQAQTWKKGPPGGTRMPDVECPQGGGATLGMPTMPGVIAPPAAQSYAS